VVTVALMTKRSKRLIRPKTPGDYLAKLPQFEPHPVPFRDLQEKPGEPQQTLDQQIDDVLSAFMAPYIHDAIRLKSFLKDAKRAIAAYVGARETEYDRRKARKLLAQTSTALERTRQNLQKIAQWPELSNYLKRVYRRATLTERPEPSSEKQVKKELQRIAVLDENYSEFAPDQMRLRLSQLETVVSLAAERVTFGHGDAQRDQIAQDLADQLASAWRRATKRLPTCSRSTPRLKNLSPFARLLKTINQELLADHHRSANDFLEYGVKSVKRVRQSIVPDC
jgi:hypothetical protein